MNAKEVQKEAASIADELLSLETDSEAMLASPDDMADLAILTLQCKIFLGQVEALKEKIERLQKMLETAENGQSVAMTNTLLQQYLIILRAKEVAVTKHLEALNTAKKVTEVGSQLLGD